jgi:hypothetical protein
MVLVWHGENEAAARDAARHDLERLERQLAEYDARLPDDGSVRLAFGCAEIDDSAPDSDRGERRRLRELVGQVVGAPGEAPLARRAVFFDHTDVSSGGP